MYEHYNSNREVEFFILILRYDIKIKFKSQF